MNQKDLDLKWEDRSSLATIVRYDDDEDIEWDEDALKKLRSDTERAAHVKALRWAAERYGKLSAAIGEQISVDAREVELCMKTIE